MVSKLKVTPCNELNKISSGVVVSVWSLTPAIPGSIPGNV